MGKRRGTTCLTSLVDGEFAMASREYFINAIQLLSLNGSKNVPTAVLYHRAGEPLIGSEAIAQSNSDEVLNEDFKVELGNVNPSTSMQSRRHFPIATGGTKTASEISADFLRQLLKKVRERLETNGLEENPTLLLAEPLSMRSGLAEQGWLSNYRRTLERILQEQKIEKIDFLPEPFAVFQYYRHGMRHPIVAERARHNALVVDFGGGTFDVCIVSTTREGDISQSGRNSRPLAADSVPIGGFAINRYIARQVIRKVAGSSARQKIKKALDAYQAWYNHKTKFEHLDKRYQDFVLHFDRVVHGVEEAKLALCKSMSHWSLGASLAQSVPCVVPKDPFVHDTPNVSVQYSADELRGLFVDEIWPKHLRQVVMQTLQRAQKELDGAPVTVVLLSGGSANIGWLRELILRDFESDLQAAEVLVLDDFQEVVAKGLAVESARRFYSDSGDFGSVTYNRLCLLLSPDETGPSPKRFVARSEGLPDVSDHPGVLLPSASVVREFVDTPMVWKVRLEKPPRRRLDYWFLKSSFDYRKFENLQNIEEKRVFTPPTAKGRFDQALRLELRVERDGTARPRFIYRAGRSEDESIYVDGKPFFLDMTFNKSGREPTAYVGLDFGSSNTSISFVDQRSVQIYNQRATDKYWRGLNKLVSTLPYPVAEPLGRYLGETEPTGLARGALEVTEATLALGAYAAYLEWCANCTELNSRVFKGFTHRSAGPLLALLRDVFRNASRSTLSIFAPFRELVESQLSDFVSESVTGLAQIKHGKADPKSVDTFRLVSIMTNVCHKTFEACVFGRFEAVHRMSFSTLHEGKFRLTSGIPPFLDSLVYEGEGSYGSEECFISADKAALSLFPLVFWHSCESHPEVGSGHCYLYDSSRSGESYSFKAVGSGCTIDVAEKGAYAAVWQQLAALKIKDAPRRIVNLPGLDQTE